MDRSIATLLDMSNSIAFVSNVPHTTKEAEASALKALFRERVTASQAAFGREYGIGSGAMVWQYLNGNRPLSLVVALRFAKGLGVPIAEFSKRLAAEANVMRELLSELSQSQAANTVTSIAAEEKARYDVAAWPFNRVSRDQVARLPAHELALIEGVILKTVLDWESSQHRKSNAN